MVDIDFRGDTMTLLFLSFWIMWTLYFVYNTILFFMNRKSMYIKSRSPWLIFSSAMGQYLMITSQTWKIVLLPENFPNMVDHWFLWFMMPLHFLPYPIRTLRSILVYHVVKSKKLDDDSGENVDAQKGSCTETILDWFRQKQFLLTDKAFLIYNWVLMAILIVWAVIRNVSVSDNFPDKIGGGTTSFSYISMTVILLVVEVFMWLCIYGLRSIHDELKVNTELITIAILWLVFLIPFIITGWISLDDVISRRIPPIFNILLCFISFLISFGMPIHLAVVKPPDVKFGTDVLDNIDKLLEDEVGSKLLLQYMERRLCTENLKFYRAVEYYRTISDPNELKKEYSNIVDTYINPNGILHVNIPDNMVKTIMAQNTDTIDSESFKKPLQEVKKLLATNVLPEFKSTPECLKYANELNANALQLEPKDG